MATIAPKTSVAAVSAITPAFQNYFGFSSSMQWITYFLEQGSFGPKILTDLNSGHPTYMTGCGSFTGDCHAWISDGYQFTPSLSLYFSMNWRCGGGCLFHPGTYCLKLKTQLEPFFPNKPLLFFFPAQIGDAQAEQPHFFG